MAATLMAMGFTREDSVKALTRTNNNLEIAVDLISSGKVDEEGDAEFEYLMAAPDEPAVREATVFHEIDHTHRQHASGVDPFVEGSSTLQEQVDSRIASFTAMGFTVEQTEAALRKCNNDVNEALSLLLSGDTA